MINVVPYKSTGTFRHWCMKVLPTVYDDSLSYYELLCKVVNYLNDLIENVDGLHEDIVKIINYINSLKIDDEVERLLDKMVKDGTLDDIVARVMAGIKTYVGRDKEWNVHECNGYITMTKREELTQHYEVQLDEQGNSNYAVAPKVYIPLDMPIKGAPSVSLDGYFGVASMVNLDKRCTLSFRNIVFDKTGWRQDLTLVNGCTISGVRAEPPQNPINALSSNRFEVVNVAKSYFESLTKHQRTYAYDINFINSVNTNVVNDANGNGIMECDTLAFLVLTGIPFDKSPYRITTPNYTYDFNQLVLNPDEKVWALPWKFDSIFNRKITYTGAINWWLWYHDCVFKDYHKIAEGDIVIFTHLSGGYFDHISHIGILDMKTVDGEKVPYVYHFSGLSAVGNEHMRYEPLADVIARGNYDMGRDIYFARPDYSRPYELE